MSFNFFALALKGLEGLLQAELSSLGLKNVRETVAGVSCSGDFIQGSAGLSLEPFCLTLFT